MGKNLFELFGRVPLLDDTVQQVEFAGECLTMNYFFRSKKYECLTMKVKNFYDSDENINYFCVSQFSFK